MRNFIIVRILSDAELWCFSFVTLFNLQGTRPARLSGGTFDILADSFRFVKHFFDFFQSFFSALIRIGVPARQLDYYTKPYSLCQAVFSAFSKLFCLPFLKHDRSKQLA